MDYDAIIIGSGVTGLTGGLYLAKQGKRVLILEKGRRVAPVISGFTRQGLRFDTGLHVSGGLADGEILHSILQLLGIASCLHPMPLRQDSPEIVHVDDGPPPMSLPRGRDALRAALLGYFPGEQRAIDAYFAETLRLAQSSPFLNPDLREDDEQAAFLPEQTLADFLARHTDNPLLGLVLSLRCLLHGVPAGKASLRSHALVDSSMQQSLCTLQGGGNALAKALAAAFRRHGGTLRTRCGARRILIENNAVSGVVTENGLTHSAPLCLFTAHPALLPDMAPPDAFRPVYRRRLESLQETVSCCMLFARIAGETAAAADALEGRSFYLCPNVSFDRLLDGRDPESNVVYFSVPPREKPESPLTLTAIMPCESSRFAPWEQSSTGRRPAAYIREKNALLRHMEQRILRKFPILEGRLVIVDGATPLTLGEYGNNPRKGIYGVLHNADGIPLLPKTRVRGLLLAGQSIVLPGILGCMVSAFVACRFAANTANIHEDLRRCRENV